MRMTMSHKILAKHAGISQVRPGDIVTCRPDWAVVHDMFFNVDGQDLYKMQDIWIIRSGASYCWIMRSGADNP